MIGPDRVVEAGLASRVAPARMTTRPQVRLGFVLCPSFHGATLLALLLNNHSEISTLGDTNPTRAYDQTCACREKVSTCGFWQTVRDRLRADRFSDLDSFLPVLPSLPWPLSNHTFEGGSRNESPFGRAAGQALAVTVDSLSPILWNRRRRAVSDYVEVWRAFYSLVSELHGTSMVVDGGKASRKVEIIAGSIGPVADAKVIHLVRDPRGFVASSRRSTGRSDLRAVSWSWADLHRRIERLGARVQYLRVRYEDLAVRPAEQMAAVFDFLGVTREPVIGPPRFPDKHHLMGNRMLFKFNGSVDFEERWRTELTAREQVEVLEYAGKMAARCGYS